MYIKLNNPMLSQIKRVHFEEIKVLKINIDT